MRQSFAHNAVVTMDTDGDLRALGGAITVALCWSWEHEPPCPLAPHHTRSAREDGNVYVRTLFACEPAREAEVRSLIGSALDQGDWVLVSHERTAVSPDEAEHAARLVASP